MSSIAIDAKLPDTTPGVDFSDNDPEHPLFRIVEKHGWPSKEQSDAFKGLLKFSSKLEDKKVWKSFLLSISGSINVTLVIVLFINFLGDILK